MLLISSLLITSQIMVTFPQPINILKSLARKQKPFLKTPPLGSLLLFLFFSQPKFFFPTFSPPLDFPSIAPQKCSGKIQLSSPNCQDRWISLFSVHLSHKYKGYQKWRGEWLSCSVLIEQHSQLGVTS